MRCNNCGWINEPNAKKCVKCNAPLIGSMIGSVDGIPERDSNNEDQEPRSLRDTMREINDIAGENVCPRCGYNVSPSMSVCPVCQTPLSAKDKEGEQKVQAPVIDNSRKTIGTINPWSRGMYHNKALFCQLQPIPWDEENIEYQPLSYSGEEIVLNRANTDPNNQTITSKKQATLSYDNGEWYIENNSEHKSTFIQVNKKTKLSDGDIIVMGNRFFVFHEK